MRVLLEVVNRLQTQKIQRYTAHVLFLCIVNFTLTIISLFNLKLSILNCLFSFGFFHLLCLVVKNQNTSIFQINSPRRAIFSLFFIWLGPKIHKPEPGLPDPNIEIGSPFLQILRALLLSLAALIQLQKTQR